MFNILRSVKALGIAISLGLLIAKPVFAESAPVYDVDNVPQQVDDSVSDSPGDQAEADVPPPAPGQEGAYVSREDASNTNNTSSAASMSTSQRLRRVEQQVSNMQTSSSGQKVDALQDQVQALRGQVDQLTKQLEQLQSLQKSQYVDLDKRLMQQATGSKVSKTSEKPVVAGISGDDPSNSAALTAPAKSSAKTARASSSTTVAAAKTSDDDPNVAEEQQIYQTAYNLIKAKKYDQAVTALQSMLQKYPSGQFASNAHYWLGELYGLMGKNDQALTEFNTVVKNYPDSPRLSDAQLKLGLIYAAESNWADAKASFRKVVNRYPGTAPARLASEQLKQIKQAGH
jgi:tol-pal system protein YbgF